jgi:hypothetical protein
MDIKVFITNTAASCSECGDKLGCRAWITLVEHQGALCLSCADLDHLVFLPSGDGTLTRRTRKHSTLSSVVLRWSRARKRYERQGLLVEAQALERAEEECLSDREVRARRREREAERREALDRRYVERFAVRIRELFPHCPSGREIVIAEHACLKYSGRVGRSSAAKSLDENAVRLAVIAHIRHAETKYDSLLANDPDRTDAHAEVADTVTRVLTRWKGPE